MSKLDEVIEARERCAAYPDCHFCFLHAGDTCGWIRDALVFLKMYRSDKLQYEADRKNWNDTYAVKLAQLESATAKHIQALKELQIGLKNDPLTWEELFIVEMIGKPVWSEEKRSWMLLIDSAPDNRSWVDLADACGKITRLGPHDLEKYRLYRKERKA